MKIKDSGARDLKVVRLAVWGKAKAGDTQTWTWRSVKPGTRLPLHLQGLALPRSSLFVSPLTFLPSVSPFPYQLFPEP